MKLPSSVNLPGSVSPYSAIESVSDSALLPVNDRFSSSSLQDGYRKYLHFLKEKISSINSVSIEDLYECNEFLFHV